MPPGGGGNAQPSSAYRRSNAPGRHRENRPQTPVAGPSRRRRSRSPEVRMNEDPPPVARGGEGGAPRRRKKSSSALSAHSSNVRSARDSVASDDVSQGKAKQRHRPHSQVSEDQDNQGVAEQRSSGKSKRRESSRSRDPSRRNNHKLAVSGASGDEEEDVDVADYSRMKRELEDVKRQLHSTDKKIRKQNIELDRLKKDLASSQQTSSDQLQQITQLKAQSKKSEDLITVIENHMNCNICMDMLTKPYGLSPCGHVLCMECLQEWFRTAAPNEDDMDDDDHLDLVYRKKICPVCRAHVRSRPIPLFVIKSIASTLEKHKGAASNSGRRPSPPPQADPWAGIFMDPDQERDNDDDGDPDEDDDYDEHWSSDDDVFEEGYGSGYDYDEDDDYQGPWVQPHWEPPNGELSPVDYAYLDDIEGEELTMLRRGCTLQMTQVFRMSYTHDTGLQAFVDGDNIIYLGWNVHLIGRDHSGEEFMEWITRDIHERPERWDRIDNPDGTWQAWRLVMEGELQEYDTTDSEVWFDGQMGEDELDLL